MPDRVEREIEEILARLEDLPAGGQPERRPVSIVAQREARKAAPAQKRQRRHFSFPRINPAAFLISGAGTIIGGLVLASVWGPLIWAAFGGVIVFLGGFVASFLQRGKSSGAGAGGTARGHYWRDRYIEYTPDSPSLSTRIRRTFRRK